MAIDLANIKGSIPPVVTPFKNGEVDYETYAKLIDYQIDNGTHGILVNGTTAEPSTLTTEERNKLVDVAVKTVDGRVPVVAATGSQSLWETKLLTAHAAGAGVDALLIVTPYYIKPPQRGLISYYEEVTCDVNLPWMIYHIPGRTGVAMTVDSLKEIRTRCPHFSGMKQAYNDLGMVTECLEAFGPEFKIFVGLEELSFPMMAVGACGLMNAVGNICPRPLSDMCVAVWQNDLNKGRQLHQQLLTINQSIFYETNPIPMKYMMKRMGLLKQNEHRLPMSPATPELEQRLDEVLKSTGLL